MRVCAACVCVCVRACACVQDMINQHAKLEDLEDKAEDMRSPSAATPPPPRLRARCVRGTRRAGWSAGVGIGRRRRDGAGTMVPARPTAWCTASPEPGPVGDR
jgi:hypothetical protein